MTQGAPAQLATSLAVDERETLVREVARALHVAGAPAHRLEQTIDALSTRMGLEARVFSMPTALQASFGPESDARTVLIRVEPGGLDLGQLAEVDAVCRALLEQDITPDVALEKLARAERRERWGPAWEVPAFGLASMAATVLLGGSLGDLAASGLVGVLVGLSVLASTTQPRMGSLTDLVAGLLAALAAGAWARGVHPVDAGLVTVSSLIVLVPGLTLTTAITELSSRHLVSGTARLAGAFVTFASLGLGALLGAVAMRVLPVVPAAAVPLPDWAVWPAWIAAALSFVPLMQTRLKDLPLLGLSTLVGLLTLRVLAGALPPAITAAAAALAVGLASNALARLTDRPAAVPLVPALFLLVPGSTGFRSLVELLGSDVQAGLDHAIAALVTAAALAAGVVVAQAIVTPRRAL